MADTTLETVIANNTLLTQMRDTANGGFDRETDSLEAIRDAINALSLGAGTATSLNQELIKDNNTATFAGATDSLRQIRASIGTTIITGAANRRLEDTPYYLGSSLSVIKAPTVDQPSIVVAYQSLANVNGALPTTAEITPGTVDIDRFRDGTDADWTSVVAASALTEANGIVRFPYTFPAASWQVGDLVRVRFTASSVVFGGKTVTIPDAFGFTDINGLVAADSAGTTFLEYIVGNKADAAQTDGGATRSVIAHLKGILNRLNDATFGLSALNTDIDLILTRLGTPAATNVSTYLEQMRETADGGYNRETDSLEAIRDFTATLDTDLDAIITYHNVPAGDSADNIRVRDVVGNKSDTTITDVTAFTNTSAMRKLLTLQRAEKLVIQDTDIALAAIDTTLTISPSGSNTPDPANTILSLNFVTGTAYTLENLILQITSLGTGTFVTIGLWQPVNGTVVQVKTVTISAAGPPNQDYATSEYLHLMDLFGLPRITADSIHVTAITDVGNTSALSATYNYGTWRAS